MIEAVFSESLKGSLKVAKSYSKESKHNSAIAYIGDKQALKQLQSNTEGEALEGSSNDVVFIGCNLDIGDISCVENEESRKDVLKSLFSFASFEENEMQTYLNRQRNDLSKLINAAKSGTAIRVWKSNAPYSACAYAYLCNTLKSIDCEISVMELPTYWQTSETSLTSYTDWAEIAPYKFYQFLSIERKVSTLEKCLQSNIWTNLKEENAALRAVVNGKLISVPENFYDHLILNNLPSGEFEMARFIGTILGKYPLGIGDAWYALRIEKMIKNNILQLVSIKDCSHQYSKILKKVK
ncbi:DUF1835 domain-containing protein [Clostridium sp. 'deep sea']|uniref:DUF3658 domain-containing protein n=1 Tax=Clostridium sp. 'deep sea' TaxID=2779445 RepID=UPI0018965F36|nr:DUF3658 domain-containing protein [Clostridium sp. 'deep sea']QOR35234.1 DUF1835 domain-containing protein [Clostridium sp. 'deep sea']